MEEATYGYDGLDRLVGVQYPGGKAEVYRLDPVGNRLGERELANATNLAFGEWPTSFPNAAGSTALFDRHVHHSEIISIEGESSRKREAEADKEATATRRRRTRS